MGNKVQTDYREASKEKIKRQLEISGKTATDEELEQMLEGGGGARLTGHIHIEGNEEQLRATINDIEQRHEMFMKLETSIKELHEMFMDMAVLVEQQGEVVNRIDAHVDNAVEYTTRASADTKKALEYQQKARRKKIMMILCVLISAPLGTWMASNTSESCKKARGKMFKTRLYLNNQHKFNDNESNICFSPTLDLS